MEYVSSKEAQSHYKVCGQTLTDWADKGTISFIKTSGGHRRYGIAKSKAGAKSIVYARVSSKKQESNLENQIKYLKERYPDLEVISDIGSGINFKRPGFRRVLESIFKGDIKEVVVTSSDRFSRFGRDLFEWLFEQFGAKLTILNSKTFKSDNEELSDDLMEIITVFTARYYGQRKYRNGTNAVLSQQSSESAA